jgi:mRNA interferase HigB
MVIISKTRINAFILIHADADEALMKWYIITKQADWSNFNELKQCFGTTDCIGDDLYVFNIKGNHYRLIARIIFGARTIFIKFIGTHAEYDKFDITKL